MSRLKNLYTLLVTNGRAEVDGWLDAYLAISGDVAKVGFALKTVRWELDPVLDGSGSTRRMLGLTV